MLLLKSITGGLLLYLLFAVYNYGAMTESKEIKISSLPKGNRQIPILCYHNIYVNPPQEDQLWISLAHLELQLKMLRDSGYSTVLPEDIYQHFTSGMPLPQKAVTITFDDGHAQHFSLVAPLLSKYGFKAAFFIPTAFIGKKYYLTEKEIRILADSGHTIGCHTYDHPSVASAKMDWGKQFDSCRQQLEKITGQPVYYFAYPYGIWTDSAISQLKARHFRAAFQLTGKTSPADSLFTLKRLMISGAWPPDELRQKLRTIFPN
ncbi:MAG: polysaccharide deacetylase family protein [Chitinophagaceae bacterium]|nr:polysaccharide deacetylase family protein [Chitinophagaceae bacterium]